MGMRVGYSDSNPLTTALLNQLAAYLVAQDGNGNAQQLLSVRIGPNAFLLADPAGTVWLAYNAFYDPGSSAWYPANTGQASYAIQISSSLIAFQYSPVMGGAGALTWQLIDGFTSSGLNSIAVAMVALTTLESDVAGLETGFAALQGQINGVIASLANAGTLIFASTTAAQASGSLANGAYYYVAPSAYSGGALDLYKKISSSSSTFIATLPGVRTLDVLFGASGDGVLGLDGVISLSTPNTISSPI